MRIFRACAGRLLVAAIWVAGSGASAAQELPPLPYSPVVERSTPSNTPSPGQAALDHPLPAGEGFFSSDSAISPVSWLEQPALSTPDATAPTARRSTRGSRQGNVGLASVPNMFGDLAGSGATISFKDPSAANPPPFSQATFSLPVAGGGSRIGKISENDSPIPRDRIFFSYNGYQNVIQLSETPGNPPGPTVFRQDPINRYTLGGEKTFYDGWTSVEVRMPLQGTIDSQLTNVGLNSGSVGNLTVVLKSLLYMDSSTAVGAGMAIETPTGSDTFARFDSTNLQFKNQSYHLLPYIGFVWSPGDPRWGWGSGLFLSGFAQMDINTSSNPVDVLGLNRTVIDTLGKLTDQNLGFLDIAAGYWLYRNPDAQRLTGVATITELHYTTTLQNADRINGTANFNSVILNGSDKRFDVLNGTVGLQFLMFDASSLRVAGVFPIGNENRRLFDSEIQVQFNRRF